MGAFENCGYSVSFQKKQVLTEKQIKSATTRIFSEPAVIEQLKYAKTRRDSGFTAYSGEEEAFTKLVDEVNDQD